MSLRKWIFGDPERREEIERQLKTLYPSVETTAEKKVRRDIARLLKKRATPQLIYLLGDPDLQVRLKALDALAQLADGSSVQAIVNLLRDVTIAMDPKKAVRKRAAELLSKIGWEPDTDDDKVLYWLANDQLQLCAELGVRTIPLLMKAYKRGLVEELAFCDFINETFTTPEAIYPMIVLLKDALASKAQFIRKRAMFTLMGMGEPVIEPLNKALLIAAKSGDEKFENDALTILANLRFERTTETGVNVPGNTGVAEQPKIHQPSSYCSEAEHQWPLEPEAWQGRGTMPKGWPGCIRCGMPVARYLDCTDVPGRQKNDSLRQQMKRRHEIFVDFLKTSALARPDGERPPLEHWIVLGNPDHVLTMPRGPAAIVRPLMHIVGWELWWIGETGLMRRKYVRGLSLDHYWHGVGMGSDTWWG